MTHNLVKLAAFGEAPKEVAAIKVTGLLEGKLFKSLNDLQWFYGK